MKTTNHEIYLEIGNKKTFACAVHWPGWCRSGKDEQAALQALLQSAPRYAHLLEPTRLNFEQPYKPTDFLITARVGGNASTDFGVPEAILPGDWEPVSAEEASRYQVILRAAWDAFDGALSEAAGRELRKGPRGGGRELQAIIEHVLGADAGYLQRIGRKVDTGSGTGAQQLLELVRGEILRGIEAGVGGNIPARGPRGGKMWPLHYYVRRAAWHVIDHAWEIEDRVM